MGHEMAIEGELKAGGIAAQVSEFTRPALMGLMAGGLALAAWAGMAHAEEPKKDWTLTGSVSGTTDYVFRGFSQTAGSPTLQGTVDFSYRMFYVGTFLSGLDFVNDSSKPGVANVETDVYAGVKFPIGRFDIDLGGIYYLYPGANDNFAVTGFRELDYFEFKAGASFKPFAQWTLGTVAYYSPEYTNKTGAVWTFEGTSSYEFHKLGSITPTFGALVGYQMGDDAAYKALVGNGKDNYWYWNAGVTLGFGDNFSLDFRYWDTNVSNTSNFCSGNVFQCDERFVGTAKVTF